MLRFAVPDYLYLLAAIPLLTAVYLLAVRSRRRRLERFGNPQTLAELMPEASPTRMRNKAVFFLTALALLAVAMARPQRSMSPTPCWPAISNPTGSNVPNMP